MGNAVTIQTRIQRVMDPIIAALAAAGITGEVKGTGVYIPTVAEPQARLRVFHEYSTPPGPLYNWDKPYVEIQNMKSPFLGGFCEYFRGDRAHDYNAMVTYINKLGKPGPNDL